MNEDLHAGLNEHLALEFGAAHQYLALAIWCELNDLPGFASWLKLQSTDELSHAHRIIDHFQETRHQFGNPFPQGGRRPS